MKQVEIKEMAQGEKIPVEVFEEVLKKVLEEEKDTNWRHAKKFEHTDMWRKSEDDSSIHLFKVVSLSELSKTLSARIAS